jgi:ABC-type dipeptide/oligopeptide/nickel transport system permease subunit
VSSIGICVFASFFGVLMGRVIVSWGSMLSERGFNWASCDCVVQA